MPGVQERRVNLGWAVNHMGEFLEQSQPRSLPQSLTSQTHWNFLLKILVVMTYIIGGKPMEIRL